MPVIDIPNKICSHCGGTKWSVHNEKRPLSNDPDRVYVRYRCAVLTEARRKRWNESNQEYVKEYTRQRDVKRRAEGYFSTPEKLAYYRAKAKEYNQGLTDYYITSLWRKKQEHRDYELTPEEMKIYKEYLLIHRQIKQLNNGKKN